MFSPRNPLLQLRQQRARGPVQAWQGAGLRKAWWRIARLLAVCVFVLGAFFPSRAWAAFEPPPLRGHVVDTGGKLTSADVAYLDQKLDGIRRRTGFAIVAFIAGSLEGETPDDVAYKAFNKWQIGEKGRDNGVLLLIAPAERQVRIETGKGVGGALTDLQSNDIIRQTIIPYVKQDRFREAIDRGVTAIATTLVQGSQGDPGVGPRGPAPAPPPSPIHVLAVAAGLLVFIVLMVISPAFRMIVFGLIHFLLLFGGRGGRGGGGGGSGYSGGGGRSGGGGSSEGY